MKQQKTHKKSRFAIKSLMRPLLFALAFVYLGFHVMHGERGLYALFKESHRKGVLQEELDRTTTQREQLELRVSHMRSDSLDLDLLDEQYRRMLGGVQKNEMMILLPKPSNHSE